MKIFIINRNILRNYACLLILIGCCFFLSCNDFDRGSNFSDELRIEKIKQPNNLGVQQDSITGDRLVAGSKTLGTLDLSPTATLVPLPTATLVPVRTEQGVFKDNSNSDIPVATPTPISTPTPNPTATAIPTPTPSPTQIPPLTRLITDDRYGVVLHSKPTDANEYFLNKLGVKWFYNAKDSSTGLADVPVGAQKILMIRIPDHSSVWTEEKILSISTASSQDIGNMGFTTREQIQETADKHPGSAWYLYGEFNRFNHINGKLFAHVFEYYSSTIRSFDSSAIILGPSVLNWDYTCEGCFGFTVCDGKYVRGYKCGKRWIMSFLDEYEDHFGKRADVDIWIMDVYPIDWVNVPNGPEHADISIDQIIKFRTFLNQYQYDNQYVYQNSPIWLMELGLHVGFDSWGITDDKIHSIGSYRWDKLAQFMNKLMGWLNSNAGNNLIQKWFMYVSWYDPINITPDGHMGIGLFDGPNFGADLNCLGAVYRSWATKGESLSCNSNGVPVDD